MIRKATFEDIDAVEKIYEKILTEEEEGRASIGWQRGVYPSRQVALDALEKGTLFVLEVEEAAADRKLSVAEDSKAAHRIAAAAKIDQELVPIYRECKWEYPAPDSEVMILHTLVVDPELSGRGYGKQFVKFYEDYALENGCRYLHMDTNAINAAARKLYKGLGYTEADILPCVFNGIEGVKLVCLEKKL